MKRHQIPRAVRHPLEESGIPGRAWRWSLSIAAAVATVVTCLFPLTSAMWDARLAQDSARAPVGIAFATNIANDAQIDGAIALYDQSFEQLGGNHVEVIWLQNLAPEAEPPPGLDRWPGPREVIASPGLLAASGGRQFANRYGTVTGTITAAGLVDPTEKLAYVGIDPETHVATISQNVVGSFGAPQRVQQDEYSNSTLMDSGYTGNVLYQWSRTDVFITLTLFGVAPCLVLIGIVVRLGGERRDQYISWLTVIGASPGMIREFLLRESAVPVSLGCSVGLVPVGLAMLGTWPVPGMGSFVVGAYLRSAWSWCLGAAVLVALIMLTALFLTHRTRPRLTGPRPRAKQPQSRPWLILVLVAVIAAQSYLYSLIYPTNPGTAATISALASASVVVLLAPTGGAVLAVAGVAIRRFALKHGSPVALVTSSELTALPRPALRTAAVVGAAIVITVQAVLLMAGPDHRKSMAVAAAKSDPMLTASVSVGRSDQSWLGRANQELPSNLALMQVETAATDETTVRAIRTTCTQLQHLKVQCAQEHATFGDILTAQPVATREALAASFPLSTPVEVIDQFDAGEDDFWVMSTDQQRLDDNELTRIFGQFASPAPTISHSWQAWLGGATVDVAHARWLIIAGILAGVILLTAASLALSFEAIRVARRMASLTMLIDKQRTTNYLGIGLVGVPILAATALGIAAAIGIAVAPTSIPFSPVTMPWGYFAALTLLGIALAISMGLIVARTIRSYGSRWIPVADDA